MTARTNRLLRLTVAPGLVAPVPLLAACTSTGAPSATSAPASSPGAESATPATIELVENNTQSFDPPIEAIVEFTAK